MKKALVLFSIISVFAMMNFLVASAAVTTMYPKGTSEHVNVYVNDGALQTDVPAKIISNRTMVPLRAICEALGAHVEWKSATNSVVISKDDTTIELKVGSKDVMVNGQQTTLDVAPQVINDRTMVPIHFLSNTLGAHVGWDGTTQSVFVSELPLPTIHTVQTYFQSIKTNYFDYLNKGADADSMLRDYLNGKISYATFKSQFPIKVQACQNSLTAIEKISVPDDATVQKMVEKNNKLLQESVDYFTHCQNAIYADHIDHTALKSAFADIVTINADEDAFFAEYTYNN